MLLPEPWPEKPGKRCPKCMAHDWGVSGRDRRQVRAKLAEQAYLCHNVSGDPGVLRLVSALSYVFERVEQRPRGSLC